MRGVWSALVSGFFAVVIGHHVGHHGKRRQQRRTSIASLWRYLPSSKRKWIGNIVALDDTQAGSGLLNRSRVLLKSGFDCPPVPHDVIAQRYKVQFTFAVEH
jgi:hypothetical protein